MSLLDVKPVAIPARAASAPRGDRHVKRSQGITERVPAGVHRGGIAQGTPGLRFDFGVPKLGSRAILFGGVACMASKCQIRYATRAAPAAWPDMIELEQRFPAPAVGAPIPKLLQHVPADLPSGQPPTLGLKA